MTKLQQEYAYLRLEELRKAAKCFNIIRTIKYKTSDDENSYSLSAHLYGAITISNYDEYVKYFNRAKQFFLDAFQGEDEYIEKIEKIEA